MKAILLTALLTLTALSVAPVGVVESADACMYLYTRTDAGQLTVIRRSTCAPPEPYWCPYEGAPLNECDPLVG